jgi:UDP-N-acetylmuramoyl-tripeptide--D-alanyl-D-alanine ligase
MVANAVAAMAASFECSIPLHTSLAAIESFAAPEGRGASIRLGPAENPLLLIDQSYNANSASMAAALDVFGRQSRTGRKVLVLGDMLELGREAPRLHAGLRDAVIASGADRIYLVGSEMKALADVLGPDRVTAAATGVADIADAVLDGLAYGDAVMVKGSNGVGLAGLVKKIRERFA